LRTSPLDRDTTVAGDHQWNSEKQCRKAVAAVNAAGSKSAFLAISALSLRGNTHMMMDLNNLQSADWILSWLERNILKKLMDVESGMNF
jgi:hypothetical protein